MRTQEGEEEEAEGEDEAINIVGRTSSLLFLFFHSGRQACALSLSSFLPGRRCGRREIETLHRTGMREETDLEMEMEGQVEISPGSTCT